MPICREAELASPPFQKSAIMHTVPGYCVYTSTKANEHPACSPDARFFSLWDQSILKNTPAAAAFFCSGKKAPFFRREERGLKIYLHRVGHHSLALL